MLAGGKHTIDNDSHLQQIVSTFMFIDNYSHFCDIFRNISIDYRQGLPLCLHRSR